MEALIHKIKNSISLSEEAEAKVYSISKELDVAKGTILIEQGQSMNAIAQLFNSMELKTPSGRGTWSHTSVSRVLERYKKIKKENK